MPNNTCFDSLRPTHWCFYGWCIREPLRKSSILIACKHEYRIKVPKTLFQVEKICSAPIAWEKFDKVGKSSQKHPKQRDNISNIWFRLARTHASVAFDAHRHELVSTWSEDKLQNWPFWTIVCYNFRSMQAGRWILQDLCYDDSEEHNPTQSSEDANLRRDFHWLLLVIVFFAIQY